MIAAAFGSSRSASSCLNASSSSPGRQVALEQEVGDLLVGRVLRELDDVVAAIHEDPAIRVDRADARLGDADAGQRDGLLRAGHRAEPYPERCSG